MHPRKPVFQYSEFVYLSEFLKQGLQVFFLQVSGNLADEKLDGVVVLHWNGVLADGESVHPAGAVRGAESILLLHSVCGDCSHLSSMGRRAALSLSLSRSLSLSLSLSFSLPFALCTLPLRYIFLSPRSSSSTWALPPLLSLIYLVLMLYTCLYQFSFV